MFRRKLRAVVEEGARHTKYFVYYGDTLLAPTVLSRSYPQLDDSLLARLARELYVSSPQLRLLLDCPWSYDEYVAHVLAKK